MHRILRGKDNRMDRDEIIQQVRRLDHSQLVLLSQFLDLLEGLAENQIPVTAPDPEVPGDG